MEIRILNNISGEELCKVALLPTTTVRDLKLAVQDATHIPATEQAFFRGPAPLEDEVVFSRRFPGISDVNMARLDAEAVREKMEGIDKVRQREDILASIKKDVCSLRRAPLWFVNEPDTMAEAVKLNPLASCYAPQTLWQDPAFVKLVVQKRGLLLEHASEALKDEEEIVLLAVENDGHSLKFASSLQRANKKVVLIAVKEKGTSLCHASKELKRDQEVVVAACENNKMAIVHAARDMRDDMEVRRVMDRWEGETLVPHRTNTRGVLSESLAGWSDLHPHSRPASAAAGTGSIGPEDHFYGGAGMGSRASAARHSATGALGRLPLPSLGASAGTPRTGPVLNRSGSGGTSEERRAPTNLSPRSISEMAAATVTSSRSTTSREGGRRFLLAPMR